MRALESTGRDRNVLRIHQLRIVLAMGTVNSPGISTAKKKQKEKPAHTDLQQVPNKVAHWESPRLQPSWESPRLQPSWKYWTDCHDSTEFGWLPLTDIHLRYLHLSNDVASNACSRVMSHGKSSQSEAVQALAKHLEKSLWNKAAWTEKPSMWRRAGKRCTVELVLYYKWSRAPTLNANLGLA